MDELKNVTALRAAQVKRAKRYEVGFGDRGKLVLPDIPELIDSAGQCAWLTAVFALDPSRPITGGKREGLDGPNGHVVLERAGAREIFVEPVSRINSPAKLVETLSWYRLPSDDPVHALKGEHCRLIAHVVRMLCGASKTISSAEQTDLLVSAFIHEATQVVGFTTYGTSRQRYEAAIALRRVVDPTVGGRPAARYLVDENTGELVVAAGELQDAARRYAGSSFPHGWLDARMKTLEWVRITLEGRGLPAVGNYRPHARIYCYRGLLPGSDEGS